MIRVCENGIEDGVGEGLPTLFGVRVGFVGTDGEGGVEPENASLGEGGEVSGNKLRKDVDDTREKTDPVLGGVKSGMSFASCL